MLPNSSLKRIYRFPSGKRARATRAVSSGMGGRAWGCNDIGLLLLVGSLVILTLFRLFYHLLLLPLLPFANRVLFCTVKSPTSHPPAQKMNRTLLCLA